MKRPETKVPKRNYTLRDFCLQSEYKKNEIGILNKSAQKGIFPIGGRNGLF